MMSADNDNTVMANTRVSRGKDDIRFSLSFINEIREDRDGTTID